MKGPLHVKDSTPSINFQRFHVICSSDTSLIQTTRWGIIQVRFSERAHMPLLLLGRDSTKRHSLRFTLQLKVTLVGAVEEKNE